MLGTHLAKYEIVQQSNYKTLCSTFNVLLPVILVYRMYDEYHHTGVFKEKLSHRNLTLI